MKAGRASPARSSRSRVTRAANSSRLRRGRPVTSGGGAAGQGQEGPALADRDLVQSHQRRPPHAAPRLLHGAQEGHIVGGIHDEAQVGQDVLDLLALVEADAAHDVVGHAARRSASSSTRDWALVR